MWFTIFGKVLSELRSEQRSKSLRYPDSAEEPIEKGDPRASPRESTPKKAIYKCLVWQLYAFDLPALRDQVMAHDRLSLTMYTNFLDHESEELLEAARSSDILLLTSGGGMFDVDGFLKMVDIRDKMVVLVSALPIEGIRAYVKSRIDFCMPKHLIYEGLDFRQFMERIVAQLDGVEPD